MCGIAGIFNINYKPVFELDSSLGIMNELLIHRGPDDSQQWEHEHKHIGFAHRRLSIIDIDTGTQPMIDNSGNVICFNGEIYNYLELRKELKSFYSFRTKSDTEVILAAYLKWGSNCLRYLKGMFAFALWDEKQQLLFCARDRFGIKPFYYTIINNTFYFASEAKVILPFLPEIKTNQNALKEYLFFQLNLDEETLFEGIKQLCPSHHIIIKNGTLKKERYWEVYYTIDFSQGADYFEEKLKDLIEDSVHLHSRSDVPIGAYISGGLDSSIIAALLAKKSNEKIIGFTGKFSENKLYDESVYARDLAKHCNIELHEIDIGSFDFIDSIRKVIYHLDYPVAGPGAFAQFHVAKLANKYRKVVLGGQGGDEIFGGYTRYLVAYFEQCIKGAIDNTLHNGNFIVTYESIIPNLIHLQKYKPMLQDFWREGLFEDIDKRYFRLINRATNLKSEINWNELGPYSPFKAFQEIFNNNNVGKESYFDKMTHFDFKTLLPALLHVEDRMSMAHGIESRVPFLDHSLIELAATIPSNIKFKDGTLKMVLLNAMKSCLPKSIIDRKDKMGFPVPLNEWAQHELKDFVNDIFSSKRTKERSFLNHKELTNKLNADNKFGRKLWGLLSLELWHQEFHDKQTEFKSLLKNKISL